MNSNSIMQKTLNKIDSLLTRQRVVGYSRAIILTIIITILICYIVGYVDTSLFNNVDFAAFYTAGVIYNKSDINNKSDLYDLEKQVAVQIEHGIIKHGDLPTIFLNPPIYGWLMAPLSKIPYFLALNMWRVIMLGVSFFTVKTVNNHLQLTIAERDLFTIFLASFPGFAAIFLGQNTFLFLGLYTASFMLFQKKHDYSAGFLLGLGLLKPQLFVFSPVVMLFQKKWYSVLGFLSGVLVVLGTSTFAANLETNLYYLSIFSEDVYLIGIQEQTSKMHSIPALVRIITNMEIGSIGVAFFSFILLTFVFGYLSFVKAFKYDYKVLISLSIIGSLLISPHLFHYDLSLLFLPLVFFYYWTKEHQQSNHHSRNYRIVIAALYVAAWFSMVITDLIRFQITVPLMIVLFVFLLDRHSCKTFKRNGSFL